MKENYCRVTYTLQQIDLYYINKYKNRLNLNKSQFICYCIENCFPLMEEELNEMREKGGYSMYKHSKKFKNTKPITITLPKDIVEKLNYYSKELGVKKSHLVCVGITIVGIEFEKEDINREIDECMVTIGMLPS